MKRILFAALLLPLSVFADPVSLSLPASNTIFSSCEGNITIQGGFTQTDSTLIVVAAQDNQRNKVCPDRPASGNVAVTGMPGSDSANPNQAKISASSLLGVVNACPSMEAKPEPQYLRICVYGNSGNAVATSTYKYDTTPAGVSFSLSTQNGRVVVNASDNKSKNDYLVCYAEDNATETTADTAKAGLAALSGTTCGSYNPKTGSSPIKIQGLTNGKKYYFNVALNPNSGSTSQFAGVQDATPVQSFSFTEAYDGAGNPVSWNCSQSNVPPVGGLLVLMLLLVLSCQRKLASRTGFRVKPGMTVVAVILLSGSAFADLGQVNLGFLGSPYRPALDLSTKPDGSQITTPFYKCMYEDKLSPLMGLEVDVHLLDGFGSLQLGMGAQYTFVNGSALLSKDGCDRSTDSVRLHMLHLRPQLTYVLDPWVDYFPLVPYLRVGLVGVGYVFQYQDGWDQENKGGPGKNMGMVFGWSAAAGLMLSLKFLEPGAAARAVSNGVYDNIYLKAEAAYMPINNFYSQGLNFSPAWPQANKSFPIFLNFGLVFEFN